MFRDAGRGAFLVVFGGTECLGSGDSSLLRMAECPNRQCGLGIPLNFRFPLTSLCGPWTGRGGTSTGDWGSLVGQALSGSPPLILMTTRGVGRQYPESYRQKVEAKKGGTCSGVQSANDRAGF